MKDMDYSRQDTNYIRGRVSAVIPVFNGERHLSVLLDSILGQTYPQMEIILPYVTGEYLIWPDSDDRLERDSVRHAVHAARLRVCIVCISAGMR